MSKVAAQQTPPARLPPEAEPDVRLERLQPPTPSLAPPVIFIPGPTPEVAPLGAEQQRFLLRAIALEGVSAYPHGVLERLYSDLIGREVSVAQIYELAAEMERLYRNDGYFLTRVVVPRQEIDNGVVTILAVEGFVSEVTFEGDIGPARQLVEAYLEKIEGMRPLKLQDLERVLLLTRDLPGINAMAALRPSRDERGAAELVVQLERKPLEAQTIVDNFGDQFTGEWEVAASASANAFTSLGENLTLTGLLSGPTNGFAENQKVVQLRGSARIGSDGAYVHALASYGDSDPGFTIEEFDFNSETLLLSAGVGYPFVRTRNLTLTGEVGFDFINSDTDILGNQTFSEDRLRVLHLDGTAQISDAWLGTNVVEATFRQGLPIFDASRQGDDLLSREDGTGVSTLIRVTASRVQGITGNLALFALVSGQYAFTDLLRDEEFEVGGTFFGRGYDFSELTGDHGFGATTELLYTVRLGRSYFDRFQLFGFYDFGKIWERGSDFTDSLSSAGVGVRVWPIEQVYFELVRAKPLTRDSQRAEGDRDPQLLFRFVARL